MLPILNDYLERLTALHEEIKLAIRDLPVAALDWSPGPAMNSIGVLVTHVAGSERYWIGDIAGRDPSGRVRDVEFEARGLDAETLSAHLDAVLEHSLRVLGQLQLDDLGQLRGGEGDSGQRGLRDGTTSSVAWALFHALEHTAIHAGQIQMTRQLWERQAAEQG